MLMGEGRWRSVEGQGYTPSEGADDIGRGKWSGAGARGWEMGWRSGRRPETNGGGEGETAKEEAEGAKKEEGDVVDVYGGGG